MVEIIRLSVEPITTPEFPDPTPIAHHVRIGDRTATLYVEAATWDALCGIARRQQRTIDQVCSDIANACDPAATFAQAARYYVFEHIAPEIPDGLLPAELRGLRPGTSRTIQ